MYVFVLMVWFNFLIVILLTFITFFLNLFFISVIEHRDKSLFLTILPEVFSLL